MEASAGSFMTCIVVQSYNKMADVVTRKKHKKRQLPVISMMLVHEEINNGDGK